MMKPLSHFILASLLSLQGASAQVGFASAAETQSNSAKEAESKVDSTLNSELQSAKNQIENETHRQKKALEALYDLNRRIKVTVVERGRALRDQMELEKSIEELEEDISLSTEQLRQQKNLLAERLRAIYKFGGASAARLIFSSTNVNTLDRNLRILGIIAKQDRDIIKNYAYDLKLLSSRKQKLTFRLEKLKKTQQEIVTKEAKLVAEQKTKAKLLDGIRRNKAFALSRLQDLKKQAGSINLDDSGLLDMIYKRSFSELKGQLDAPVSGRVIKKYGRIKDSQVTSDRMLRNQWSLPHRGWLFEVQGTAPVKSVYEGVVVYVESIPGLGKTMIIDHGDHFYTVYSGFSKPLLRTGDEVKPNQEVAQLDSFKQRNELYFEIRHFSETYDPKDWMKGFNL